MVPYNIAPQLRTALVCNCSTSTHSFKKIIQSNSEYCFEKRRGDYLIALLGKGVFNPHTVNANFERDAHLRDPTGLVSAHSCGGKNSNLLY